MTIKLHLIYKKRWISRYWQENGKRIVVDLDVANPEDLPIALLGVPPKWKSFAVRGFSNSLDRLDYQFDAASTKAGTDKILFLVYAGGNKVERLCQDKGWHFIPNRSLFNRDQWSELCQKQIDNKEVIKI